MHLYLEPIDVQTCDHVPATVCWRGRLYEVERILERWTSRSHWWGQEDIRTYYVIVTTRSVLEIYSSSHGWILSRIWD